MLIDVSVIPTFLPTVGAPSHHGLFTLLGVDPDTVTVADLERAIVALLQANGIVSSNRSAHAAHRETAAPRKRSRSDDTLTTAAGRNLLALDVPDVPAFRYFVGGDTLPTNDASSSFVLSRIPLIASHLRLVCDSCTSSPETHITSRNARQRMKKRRLDESSYVPHLERDQAPDVAASRAKTERPLLTVHVVTQPAPYNVTLRIDATWVQEPIFVSVCLMTTTVEEVKKEIARTSSLRDWDDVVLRPSGVVDSSLTGTSDFSDTVMAVQECNKSQRVVDCGLEHGSVIAAHRRSLGPAAPLQLFVKTTTGRVFSVTQDADVSVGRMMAVVSDLTGIPTQNVRLISSTSRMLFQGRLLRDYRIRPRSTLEVMWRMGAGGETQFLAANGNCGAGIRRHDDSLLFMKSITLSPDNPMYNDTVLRIVDAVGTVPFLQDGNTITMSRPCIGGPYVWIRTTKKTYPKRYCPFTSYQKSSRAEPWFSNDDEGAPLPEARVLQDDLLPVRNNTSELVVHALHCDQAVQTDPWPTIDSDRKENDESDEPSENDHSKRRRARRRRRSTSSACASRQTRANDARTTTDADHLYEVPRPSLTLQFDTCKSADDVLKALFAQVAAKLPPAMIAQGFDVYLVRPSGAEVLVDGIGPLLSPLNCHRALVVREVAYGARPAVVFDADDDTTTESSSGDEALRFSNGHADEY